MLTEKRKKKQKRIPVKKQKREPVGERRVKMELVQTVIVLTGLLVNSVSDIKEKEILIKFTALYGIIGIVIKILIGFDGKDFLLAMLPGIICMTLSFLTQEQIGCGDAWILLATGCCICSRDLFLVCMLAFAGVGMAALFLFVVLHKKGTYEVPFVPFVFAGAICVRCIGL
jgi:leader peptidase (prepilin peptidase)/N-methyltransferase